MWQFETLTAQEWDFASLRITVNWSFQNIATVCITSSWTISHLISFVREGNTQAWHVVGGNGLRRSNGVDKNELLLELVWFEFQKQSWFLQIHTLHIYVHTQIFGSNFQISMLGCVLYPYQNLTHSIVICLLTWCQINICDSFASF